VGTAAQPGQRAARDPPAPDRYVVANGDEGDPGSFVDRLLLEKAPHSVLVGMKACARAIGAQRGVIFIRGEYPAAQQRVRAAIAQATASDLLGGLSVEVFVGAGSYVAGEETALLRAIEGLRAKPRPKPPYPTECGLRGLPTVVQNVETLSAIPQLVRTRQRQGHLCGGRGAGARRGRDPARSPAVRSPAARCGRTSCRNPLEDGVDWRAARPRRASVSL
jgi:NADH:ubiquinone oxidoreductase subunit F (NADH-binding)